MLSWCVICFFLCSSSSWSQTRPKSEAEKAVAALEELWLRSQRENNPDLIGPFVADKFVATQSDGKVIGKTEMLASAKASKYSSAEYGDVKVMVFGNTAIVTGFEKLKGTDSSGHPLDVNERFTDTWVDMAKGTWQCVASQQTTNSAPDANAKASVMHRRKIINS
jgi:ketosteroid isomerase-like protein